VPLLALRIGDSLIVTVPGEATVGVGQRLRAAVTKAIAGTGIEHVVVSGLANEYISYFTTPEEYEAQHYEGGSTLYGKDASLVIQFGLTDLATALAQGKPAPAAYEFDPRNGVIAAAAPFSTGATSAKAATPPTAVSRLARAAFSWTGGCHYVTDDLGLQMDWSVDDSGKYTARWEAPLSAPVGQYRFVVTANHYRLVSKSFRVHAAATLLVTPASASGGVTLDYPPARTDIDLTARPAHAAGGRVTYTLKGRQRTVQAGAHGVFPVPAGATIAKRAAHDSYGNTNSTGSAPAK
jgi:neutral ceramidase